MLIEENIVLSKLNKTFILHWDALMQSNNDPVIGKEKLNCND